MANNGRVIDWPDLEWNITSVGSVTESGDGDPTYGHGGSGTANYIVDAIDVFTGIYLSAESSFDGTSGSWQVVYDGPGAPFGGYIVGAATYRGSVSISAIARNVKLYGKLTGSLWRLVWDQIDIYINGVFDITLTGSSLDATSAGVGPNYVPLIGMPLRVSGSCSAGRANVPTWTFDPCDPGDGAPITWSTTMDSSVSGGWRFKEVGGGWNSLPVYVETEVPATSGSCPFGLSVSDVIVSDETFGDHISCKSHLESNFVYAGRTMCNNIVTGCTLPPGTEYGCEDLCTGELGPPYVDVYYTESRSESKGGSVRLIPDLEKAIERLGTSYRALWYRAVLPAVSGAGSRVCTIDGVTVSDSDTFDPYPSMSEFLACVGTATHTIEEPFGYQTIAPCSASHSKTYNKTYDLHYASPCFCPEVKGQVCECDFSCPEFDNIDQSESVAFTFPTTAEDVVNYQAHEDPEAFYLGTWACPHWHFFFWREDWEVDGGPVVWNDYWGPIREQWLYHSSLPAPEQRRTRNSLILSPIEIEQGNTPFLDAFAGGLRWLGVHRWKTQSVDLPTSLTLSISRPGVWEAVDSECDITLGAGGVTCDNFLAGTVSVDLLLGQWDEEPFMLLHLAKQVAVAWGTNVDAMTVLLVGVDGSTTVLGTSETTYPYPDGAQAKYAGSWAIDNGYGAVSDTGTDDLASGISPATMSDPERAFAFQLAKGWGYDRLRFTFTPTDPGDPVVIEWPTFGFHTVHPEVYWESGKTAAWLWDEGIGTRWGQWTFYDVVLGFQFPPLVSALGTPPTIIDWLCFRRCVLEGVHALSGGTPDLTTELASLYDTYEGQAISVVDKFSLGVPLPEGTGKTIRGALINSFSESPPMAAFPFPGRVTTTWAATAAHCQVVYDWAQETRPLVSPVGKPAKLADDGGTPVGSSAFGVPTGWSVWEFSPDLSNDETDWKIITADGTEWATVRPWHGWFCVLLGEVPPGANPWNYNSMFGQYHRDSIEDGNVWHRRAAFGAPYGGFEHEGQVTASGDCSHPRTTEDGRPVMYLVYIRDGLGLYIRPSSDEGTTFGSETLLIPDAYFGTVQTGPMGELVALGFVYDAGTSGPGKIYMRFREVGSLTWTAAVAIKDETDTDMKFEPDTFHVSPDKSGAIRWVLTCKIEGETGISEWQSVDECQSFKQVT